MKLKFYFLLFIQFNFLLGNTSIDNQPEENNSLSLYPETIMRLTMDNSSKIKAAKHKLESAQFNFKLFESEYTQFTPLEMNSEITQKKATLITKKEQVLSSRKSLNSWQQIHDRKMDDFIKGTGTVDNYIQAFRSLINTMSESLSHENRYMDAIRDFDYICGVYFQFLGIDAY